MQTYKQVDGGKGTQLKTPRDQLTCYDEILFVDLHHP